MMDESLRQAAQEGNVSDLYRLIEGDGNVLRRVDEVEYGDTPLHIAAENGCIDFAMEIMSLKPAFARKLNQQGLSPLHLAIEKGHKELILLLIGNNAKDLVRIKGKMGETPFHYLITREVNYTEVLLPRFWEDCPECIQDVTTQNQTALHIAVRNNKFEALKLLCQMLWKTDYCENVVNQRDRNGDTALHLAAHHNQHEMLKLLLKCKADKHVTNEAGSTALDVAMQHNNTESISILRGCFIPKISTLFHKLKKQFLKYVTNASLVIFQDMDNISGEDRNALLVILGLLLTATFQASLSPPGSVWQDEDSSNSNSTISNRQFTEQIKIPGKSVMDQTDFLLFYIPTYTVFIVTVFLTLGLLKPFPRGFRTALQTLLAFLAICFDQSIFFLAPTLLAAVVLSLFSGLLFVLMLFMCIAYRVSKISVLILGCWIFPIYIPYLFTTLVGFLIFLFLYYEFWKGTVLVLAYGLLIGLGYGVPSESAVVVGCWLILSLFRFCIKRCCEGCNA